MSDDRRWEVVLQATASIERAADDPRDDRRAEIIGALEGIIARFDYCRADDIPARAILALAEAWLTALDADEQEAFWADITADTEDELAARA